MYLSKKNIILQFYIFYNPTAQNTDDFPQITTIWSQDIYFVVDESDVVMFTVKHIVMYLRENS